MISFKKATLFLLCLLLLCASLFCACDGKDASTASEIESESTVSHEDETAHAMIGMWYDPIRPRVSLTVSRQENGYAVNIRWNDSAYQVYEWRFLGHAEDGQIVTDNCQKVLVTFTDEDVFTEETIYQNGVANLYFDENGKLCWYDAKENAGEDCRFQKNTAIPS